MKRIELKANRDLISSKSYRYGDLYDSWNQIQQDHFDGKLDVYAPICRGSIEYPSIADQWKASFQRRVRNGNA